MPSFAGLDAVAVVLLRWGTFGEPVEIAGMLRFAFSVRPFVRTRDANTPAEAWLAWAEIDLAWPTQDVKGNMIMASNPRHRIVLPASSGMLREGHH
jgi:hypothetical protein